MARTAKGTIIEKRTRDDIVFAARFPAYGVRQYVTLGAKSARYTREDADRDLADIMAKVRLEQWVSPHQEQEAADAADRAAKAQPLLRDFANDWMAQHVGLRPKTVSAYRYELGHLTEYLGVTSTGSAP